MEESSGADVSNRPEGTVTFLFTDIEGSTQLLNRLRDRYEDLITQHHAIIRQALANWHGREIDTQGDAFFAAFPKATYAVRAVVDIQRALAKQEWPEGVQVRVRMGLHTGEPLLVDEGYMGMDVHRAARVGHVGYGGQVLLSETTTALVRDELPPGVALRDLGLHRLKDMQRPEPIHQLLINGLPSEFPPLKSLTTLNSNLPEQPTTFIGRNKEMTEIRELINSHRLLTVVGPGGSGKTSLSIQVAANLIEAFPQGVWFVNLEKVNTPDYLVPAVADTLQFAIDAHSNDLEPRQQLLDYLSRRSVFLVLDNFEHLLEGADFLSEIVRTSKDIHLMVTSRERLNIRDEWIYPMGGLQYPKNGNGSRPETYSGLTLFAERARQVDPTFTLSNENVKPITQICRMVDGLPLGIELAAAWVSILSCDEIVQEIERDIDFLSSDMADIPDKHRSLRAVFNQSWRRMPIDQQNGFQRLGVFHGGFSREAAQEIAGVSLVMLSRFVQRSLLSRDNQGRFDMHPLLKAYVREKLEESPHEHHITQERHSQHYVRFLNQRCSFIQGEKIREMREEIRIERANVMAAVAWAITQWEDEDSAYNALRSFDLYAASEGFHAAITYYKQLERELVEHGVRPHEGAPKLKFMLNLLAEQAFIGVTLGDLEVKRSVDGFFPLLQKGGFNFELGICLMVQGIWAVYQDENRDAVGYLEKSFAYLREEDDPFLTVACLSWLGWAHYELGELDQAGRYFQDSYDVCIREGNVLGLPYALSKLGTWADALENYGKGADYHQEALKYFEANGDQSGQGYALSRASLSTWGMKEYGRALKFAQDAFEHFDAVGHRWGTATTLCRIGFAELGLGQQEAAEDHFHEGLSRALEYKYQSTVNYALIGLAMFWAEKGMTERAIELLTLAVESSRTAYLYKAIGRKALADIQKELPIGKFTQLQEEARKKEIDEVIEEVRQHRLLAMASS